MLWLLGLRAQRVQGFAFAVASETSLDAKRSVASKFFDWSCGAVQQARESPEAVIAFRALGGVEAGGAGVAWMVR